jgi:hypothetical protein
MFTLYGRLKSYENHLKWKKSVTNFAQEANEVSDEPIKYDTGNIAILRLKSDLKKIINQMTEENFYNIIKKQKIHMILFYLPCIIRKFLVFNF